MAHIKVWYIKNFHVKGGNRERAVQQRTQQRYLNQHQHCQQSLDHVDDTRTYPVYHGFGVPGNGEQAGVRIDFEITERFMTGLEGNHHLYLAFTVNPDPVVILAKFSRAYSMALHNYCASIGHAPELMAFESLFSGWIGVTMRYFSSAECILDLKPCSLWRKVAGGD